ncbi:phage tail terminator-like protein [Castellaniella ginsengisoli]|uniref:Phage tail terminator-like protein n=1 Tax=Castellaniella ginsengisoli TaxID=546114 RepID=A0AB39D2I7_9BURK
MKTIIRAAFEKTLADWAAAQTPKIPVAYENVAFTPPATGPYLRCFLLPADTADNTMAGQLSEYRGLFQVNVVCPAGTGPTAAEALTAAITALYPAKSRLSFGGQAVMIATPMRERPALQDVNAFVIPMDCKYCLVV